MKLNVNPSIHPKYFLYLGVFCLLLVLSGDVIEYLAWRGEKEVTAGTVLQDTAAGRPSFFSHPVRNASQERYATLIHEVTYRFTPPGGKEYRGTSFYHRQSRVNSSFEEKSLAGDQVNVEYMKNRPSVSRIQTMSRRKRQYFYDLLIPCIIVIALSAHGIYCRNREIRSGIRPLSDGPGPEEV
ncbi:MAG: hypothetical protein RDV48_09495 [Candidatus Eremiobacteraeota bacterium]|nr:hypothetical protein [Candidatus Eremiobacteraeota bacterium]